MSLGFSQSLALVQKAEQIQKLSQSQRMELRQELVQKMSDALLLLIGNGPSSPASQYDDMLEDLQKHIPADLQEGIIGALAQPALRDAALKSPHVFAEYKKGPVRDVLADHFWDSVQGRFTLQEGENGVPADFETEKKMLHAALADPEKFVADIEGTESLIKDMAEIDKNSVGDAAIEELRHKRNAFHVTNALRPHIDGLNTMFRYVGSVGGDAGHRPWENFFRDVTILPRLSFIISERMQKRFASRFLQIRESSKEEEYTLPMLNTLGEYSLASIGIITPELFSLRSAEVDEAKYAEAKEAFTSVGANLDALMKKFRLQTEGTFYWNRWSVKGLKTSRDTDDWVRDFLTQTVRAESDAVLATLGFHNLFADAKELVMENGFSIEGRKQSDEGLRELLVNALNEDEFQKFLLERIKGPWYAKLNQIVSVQEGKKRA